MTNRQRSRLQPILEINSGKHEKYPAACCGVLTKEEIMELSEHLQLFKCKQTRLVGTNWKGGSNMNKFTGTLAGIAAGLLLAAGGNGMKAEASQAEKLKYEEMELLQEGDLILPEEDYSFDEDNTLDETDYLNRYLADSEGEDKKAAALLARSNDNATLEERKKLCAAALYNGMTGYERRIQVAEFALSRAEFKDVISDVVNSNPELFYIRNGYKVKTFTIEDANKTEIVDYCQGFYEYQDNYDNPLKDKIAGQVSELRQKRNEILSSVIVSGMSELEKALGLHEYIILHTEYDKAASDLYDQDGDLKHFPDSDYDIYGALIGGKAVCQGYALSYKYLMEAAGVSDIGFASNDIHVWNTITTGKGSYHIDCTWDDPSWDTLGNVRHKYFMKNDVSFTGHGNYKADRACDGTGYEDMFWDSVDTGILYSRGSYYYMTGKGVLCKRSLHTDENLAQAPETLATLDLKEGDNWDIETDTKIALVDPYIIYHDVRDIYMYNLETGKKQMLYSPVLETDEKLYGLRSGDGILEYSTRTKKGTEQKISTTELPRGMFYIPIESMKIEGASEIPMHMENGSLVCDDIYLRTVILPLDATDVRIRTWTSSDPEVAVVDINGRVKASAPGTVTITAESYDGVKASHTLSVILEGAITDQTGTVVYYEGGEKVVNQFYQIDGVTYYLDQNGHKLTGWQTIDGNRYYFGMDGVYVTGWQTIDNKQYYFNEKGVMIAVGWQRINGRLRYLSESGEMLTGWQKLNGQQYYFDENGYMVTGWQAIGYGHYYFEANGVMASGSWRSANGKLRYLGTSGMMVTGWQTISGNRYFFTSAGDMVTGWQTLGGKKYYFNGSGVLQYGFLKKGGKTYYLGTNGVRVTGWKKIKGKTYYFDKKGVMVTGWKKIKGKTYYFNKKGIRQTGWKTIKGKRYYFNSKGVRQTGWKTIKGETYYFNKNGVMLTGLQYIKGVSYYFDSKGHFIS